MPAICQVREGEPNEEKGQEGRKEGPEKGEIRPANKLRHYRAPRLHRGVSFLWAGEGTFLDAGLQSGPVVAGLEARVSRFLLPHPNFHPALVCNPGQGILAQIE